MVGGPARGVRGGRGGGEERGGIFSRRGAFEAAIVDMVGSRGRGVILPHRDALEAAAIADMILLVRKNSSSTVQACAEKLTVMLLLCTSLTWPTAAVAGCGRAELYRNLALTYPVHVFVFCSCFTILFIVWVSC